MLAKRVLRYFQSYRIGKTSFLLESFHVVTAAAQPYLHLYCSTPVSNHSWVDFHFAASSLLSLTNMGARATRTHVLMWRCCKMVQAQLTLLLACLHIS
jgi:hypothetical protein